MTIYLSLCVYFITKKNFNDEQFIADFWNRNDDLAMSSYSISHAIKT